MMKQTYKYSHRYNIGMQYTNNSPTQSLFPVQSVSNTGHWQKKYFEVPTRVRVRFNTKIPSHDIKIVLCLQIQTQIYQSACWWLVPSLVGGHQSKKTFK